MRRIKKSFSYTKVQVKNVDGKVVDEFTIDGKTDVTKVATEYFKKRDYNPLLFELQEIEETRAMSGEDFIKYSYVVEAGKSENK